MKSGSDLQRLFSAFPNSWPGAGLLLIRICVGLAIFSFGIADVPAKTSEPILLAQRFAAIVGGACLIAGLWTPVTSVLVAVKEFQVVLSFRPDGLWEHLFLALLAVSITMTGPGAWSIDARLFGRKRLDLDRPRPRG